MNLDLTDASYRKFASQFPTGVAIVTSSDGSQGLYGATLNAVTSLSMEPFLYLVCLANSSNTLHAIRKSKFFCVHYLASDQKCISNIFSSKSKNKFASIKYDLSDNGCPLIRDVVARTECKVTDFHPGGDHTIIVGKINDIFVGNKDPLMYFRGNYIE